MQPNTITRAGLAPGTSLCRAFCRDYVTLTGEGLCASGRHLTQMKDTTEKDGDDD
ncbi:MAG: hypothetical protein AAFN27_09390 [Pseudomonadota bacterium]